MIGGRPEALAGIDTALQLFSSMKAAYAYE